MSEPKLTRGANVRMTFVDDSDPEVERELLIDGVATEGGLEDFLGVDTKILAVFEKNENGEYQCLSEKEINSLDLGQVEYLLTEKYESDIYDARFDDSEEMDPLENDGEEWE